MSFINRYDVPAIEAGAMFSLWAYGRELQFQDNAPALAAGLELDVMTNGRGIATRLPVGTGYTFKTKERFSQVNIFNRGAAATAAFTLLVLEGVEAGSR